MWNPSRETKNANTTGKVLVSVFSNARGILFIDYPDKGRTIKSEYYIALLVRLKEEMPPKQPQMKKKNAFLLSQCIVSQVDRNNGKTTWITLQIASSASLFSKSASDCWLFADLKWMIQRKIFGSNEKVISETEAYFEAKDKSFNKKGIGLLEKRWNQCIIQEGYYIDE